jgi:Tol biopolymer transport system component
MTNLEDDLRAALRAKAEACRVPERPALHSDVVELPGRAGRRRLAVAACLVLLASGVVAVALLREGDPKPGSPITSIAPSTAPRLPTTSVAPDTTAPAVPVSSVVRDNTPTALLTKGSIAFASGASGSADIYLVWPGEQANRLEEAGSLTADEACPAWSPDGTQLLFGRVTGSQDTGYGSAEIVIVYFDPDSEIGAKFIPLRDFRALEGFDPHPCAVWAPDGRWIAFAGGGDVWVVDTETVETRRLPDLRPSDLEWRPGTDQLAIAGDMGTNRSAPTLSTPVNLYTVSTGDLNQLGSVEAAHITWSPDGSTLAYQGGESDPHELWLADADGESARMLVADTGEAIHGIGPVWSPTGDRIAYQRRRSSSREQHEVVLVGVADRIKTVIDPPQTDGPNGRAAWYPYSVTWSPDGTQLLYTAWSEGANEPSAALVAVAADAPNDAVVLADATDAVGDAYSHRWAPIQMWGRQTVGLVATPEAQANSISPEVTAVLNGFLDARIAGEGAEQYLNPPEQHIPLLYATSGARYEQAEFEPVDGIEWPYGLDAFKVRLFAGDTVVEQLFFVPADGRVALEYQPDGFQTEIAPTIENGQPLAVHHDYFDGAVTLHAAHPWVLNDSVPFGRRIPEGAWPTTDGGQRNDWDELMLIADPAPTEPGCQIARGAADAAAVAESVRSYSLEATDPVAVSAGGADGLMLDVKADAGISVCAGGDAVGFVGTPVLSPILDQSRPYGESGGIRSGVASGEWMRLYLFDVPKGSSIRVLAIAIVAPEFRFERAVETVGPLIDSLEFHPA